MSRIFSFFCLLFFGSLFAQAQPDLELSFSVDDISPELYTTFIIELTVTNAGTADANDVDLEYIIPNTLKAVGQGEGFPTQGTFLPNYQRWELGSLAAGETAILYLNFFNMSGTPKRLYAEVTGQSPSDLDSSPGNGTPPTVVEDDEAVIVLNDDNSPFCDLDLRIVSTPCDDQQTMDPDDDTYSVRVDLLTANTGSANITVGGTTATLLVGESIDLEDLLISNGAFTVAAELVGQATCQVQRTVQPPTSCSGTSSGTCVGNLLYNGGFEISSQYPQGWRTNTGINYEIVTDSYEGIQALSLSGETFTEMYQAIQGAPGETYNLSLAVSKSIYIIQATVQIKFLSENWQVLGRELESLNTIPYSTNYQTVNFSAVAPPNTKYVEVRIERYDGDGILRLDALCLTGANIEPCANDDLAPTLEFCPQDIVVVVEEGVTETMASWVPPISRDNCTETTNLVFTSSHHPGDVFPIGNTIVRYTVDDESGNSNSCSFTVRVVSPIGGDPDLSITRFQPIYSVRPGFASDLGYTLNNAGSTPVDLGVLATAYLSVDPLLSNDDIPVGQSSLSGIGLGRTDLRMSYTLPQNTAYGDYFVILRVDDTDVLAESNEANNVRSVPAEARAFCFGQSAFPWHEWISYVAFDGNEQTSGKSQFSSYVDQPYSYSAGQVVSYSFETTFSYVTSTPHYSVYIDKNQDALLNPDELWFEVAGDRPPSAAGAVSRTSGTATIPEDLFDGLHAVRVIMQRDEFVEFPCGGVNFGEVEQYVFDISSARSMALVHKLKQPEDMLFASPNPVNYGYVKLRAPALADQSVDVRIIDGFGRVLYAVTRDHVATEELELELPLMPQGLYRCVVIPARGQLLSVGILVE